MCVAIIVKQPISLLDHQTMEAENPHGAGVAWAADGKLHFSRGLTAKQIWEMQENGDITYPYACHYRWATHGEEVPELTHPFPIGVRAFFGELQGTATKLMIHNGVWNDCKEWAELVPDSIPAAVVGEASDTAIAAYFAEEFPEIVDVMPWAVAVLSLDDTGALCISKHGRTWVEHNGNEFSNLNWLNTRTWARSYLSRQPWSSTQDVGSGWSWGDDDAGPVFSKKPTANAKQQAVADAGFDGWEDYVRARYGDEVADAVRAEGIHSSALDELEEMDSDMPSDLQEWPEELNFDSDLVTEDAHSVNEWLAAQQRRMMA